MYVGKGLCSLRMQSGKLTSAVMPVTKEFLTQNEISCGLPNKGPMKIHLNCTFANGNQKQKHNPRQMLHDFNYIGHEIFT